MAITLDGTDGVTTTGLTSNGIDDNATSTAVTINSSNNVGIGTVSPQFLLHASGSGSQAIGIERTGASSSALLLNAAGSEAQLYARESASVDGSVPMTFWAGGLERLRIDASGNVLVGKTAVNSNAAGFEAESDGKIAATRDGSRTAIFNRLTSDGEIVAFRKDGTTVGSIVSRGSAHLSIVLTPGAGANGIGSTTNAIFSVDGTGTPADNTNDLGTASVRWDDVYATNGTIQTSDVNEKQDIEELSEAETRAAVAAKGLLRKFRWKSAVEEKGDDARIHFGIIAQDLKAAFEAEGLDAGNYGMFINSTWTDEETGEERNRMGVRYSELLAFIIAAI